MDEEILRYREAKLMEPIYRMYKVIAEKDELKAQTFMAVTMQFITEHYKDRGLTPAQVQNILRTVLLQDADGSWYAMYAQNEIQVKTAGWLTVLAADLPVTLEMLGEMAASIGNALEGLVCVNVTPADVVQLMEQAACKADERLLERIRLNESIYLQELGSFLVGQSRRH